MRSPSGLSRSSTVAVLAVVAALVGPAPLLVQHAARAETEGPNLDPVRVNVVFEEALPPDLLPAIDQAGGELLGVAPALGLAMARPKPGVEQASFMEAMAAKPGVVAALPDVRGEWMARPNDPLWDAQNVSLQYVRAHEAWDITFGQRSVVVAIVDTGVHCLHEDFRVTLGKSVCDPRSVAHWVDPLGHGTWVAGIVGAITNNQTGIAGIAGATLYPLQQVAPVLLGEAALLVLEAIEAEVDVVNFSNGWLGCADPTYGPICLPLERAILAAEEAGIVVTGSAGNNDSACDGPIAYPAGFETVLGVGGSDGNSRWGLSACSDLLDLLAPAESWSTVPEVYVPSPSPFFPTWCDAQKYCSATGTSGSAPIVAGTAALILSECPGLSPAQVRAALKGSATELVDHLGAPLPRHMQGDGRLDMYQALVDALAMPGCAVP